MNKNDVMYGLRDDDRLENSVEDVIDLLVDGMAEPGESINATLGRIKWPVVVQVFRRMDACARSKYIVPSVLEYVLDQLDEEMSDPDSDYTKPTEAMKAAARVFVEAVCDEYVPWASEPTGEVIQVTREQAKEMVE